MKTKETTHNPGERAAPTPPVASFKAGSGARNKKGPGGRRNPLIRLDLAKEIKGFSLAQFGRALLDEAGIWLNLGLACPSSPGDRRAPDVPLTVGLENDQGASDGDRMTHRATNGQ